MNFNNNNTNNIEELLQQEADQYSVYPSDKVWDDIRDELHGKQKWVALPFIFISIVVALTIATIINYPTQKFLVKHFDSPLPKAKDLALLASQKNDCTNANFIQNLNPSSTFRFNENPTYIKNIIPDFLAAKNQRMPQFDVAKNSIFITEKKLGSLLETIATAKQTEEAITYNINDFDAATASIITKDNKLTEPIVADFKKQIATKEVINYLKTFSNNVIKKEPKKSKWQVQYYATISNSYRTLEDDKSRASYMGSSFERLAIKGNVNNVVKHLPAVGGEFGVSFLYKLTKNLHLKSGVQLNIRKYGIDAYRANGNATFNYVANNKLNSLSLRAAYTTEVGNGTGAIKLDNQMYQFSVPVGLQWDFVNGERWGLSAAASLQPTFTLNKDVYVVSTDYKYYADGSSFFRRFNLNTSTELYLTLKSKNAKWFFGPQIRYQQLPTYNDIYPIKEYRVDYGIKFGFIKSF